MTFILQYLNYIVFLGTFCIGFILALALANRVQIASGIGTLFSYIGKANSEDNGQPSATRLNVFIANTLFSASLAFGFIYTVICYKELVVVYAGILSGLVAGLLSIKVWQKGKETDKPESTNG
jgi:hypothetical protein